MSVKEVSSYFLGGCPIKYFGLDPIDPRSSVMFIFHSFPFSTCESIYTHLSLSHWLLSASGKSLPGSVWNVFSSLGKWTLRDNLPLRLAPIAPLQQLVDNYLSTKVGLCGLALTVNLTSVYSIFTSACWKDNSMWNTNSEMVLKS